MPRCAGVSAPSMVRRCLRDQVSDDGLAVADYLAVVDDVGKLAARRFRHVEDVIVLEWNAREP